MKYVIFIFVGIVITGCASNSAWWGYQSSNNSIQMNILKEKVYKSPEENGGRHYTFEFIFHVKNKKYTHVIQEILLENGSTVVESFRILGNGICCLDSHRWVGVKDIRKIFVYPGIVIDADETEFGFAMLPRNRDGSVSSTTGDRFNANYRSNHKIKGRIVLDDKLSGFTWYLNFENKELDIRIPEHRKKVIQYD